MKISSLAIETMTLSTLTIVLLLVSFSMRPSGALAATQAHTYIVEWKSANVNNDCVASGGFGSWASSNKPTAGSVTYSPLNPVGSYMFTLRCTGASGSNQDGQPITANAPLIITPSSVRVAMSSTGDPNPLYVEPILTLSTNRTTVSPSARTFALTWNFSDPEGVCTASGDWSGVKSTSGRETLSLSAPFDEQVLRKYKLTCTAEGRTTQIREVPVTHIGPSSPTCPTCVIN